MYIVRDDCQSAGTSRAVRGGNSSRGDQFDGRRQGHRRVPLSPRTHAILWCAFPLCREECEYKISGDPACMRHRADITLIFSQGERFEDTKLRLQARLGVADKDFAKFRFALMQSHQYKLPSPLTDGKQKFPSLPNREERADCKDHWQTTYSSITNSWARMHWV